MMFGLLIQNQNININPVEMEKVRLNQYVCNEKTNKIVEARTFKGEFVVATILPSHKEVSYCTAGFFVA